jgi:hypothetical protein
MLSDVVAFAFSRDTLVRAREYLLRPGRRGNEGFVLFLGTLAEPVALVQTVVFPAQRALVGADGVGVHVSGDELFRISRWAADHGQIVLGQMHTHPTRAFHSTTDDTYPLVSLPGAFSIVVPNFARAPIDLLHCACYRCQEGAWLPVDSAKAFKVVV